MNHKSICQSLLFLLFISRIDQSTSQSSQRVAARMTLHTTIECDCEAGNQDRLSTLKHFPHSLPPVRQRLGVMIKQEQIKADQTEHIGLSINSSLSPKAEIMFLIDRASKAILKEAATIIPKLLDRFQHYFTQGSKYGISLFADFPKDMWKGSRQKHSAQNDPNGCYTFYQALTTNISNLKTIIASDKIKHLSGDPHDHHGSSSTALMLTAVDKTLHWTKRNDPGIKKLIILLTDSKPYHGGIYKDIDKNRKSVTAIAESHHCKDLKISPRLREVGQILNPEGIAVFGVIDAKTVPKLAELWREYGKEMGIKFDDTIIHEGEDVIFERIKRFIET